MAAGDLITADYQLEYNGLLLGAGTAYELRTITGLDDLPELRTSDRLRSLRHGLYRGRDLASGRNVVVTCEVFGKTPAALRDALDKLATATITRNDELPLVYQLPSTGKRRINCRPRRRSLPIAEPHPFGRVDAAIEFFATDPLVYDNALTSQTTGLGTTTGGLTLPLTMPLDFGGSGTSGIVTVTNAGNFDAPWTVRFDGPFSQAKIEHVGLGKTVELVLSVAAGDYVILDSKERTVMLNGTASRYGSLTSASVWFDLAPGSNSLRFGGISTGAPNMTLTFRSAWI